jgi:hypothetical protein
VKFSCDRCGKKYATAENPAPGRVYKLKCKACGNLIVVKASQSGAVEHAHAEPSAPAATAPSPTPPEIPLEIGAPEPFPPPPLPAPRSNGSHVTRAFDATTQVAMPSLATEELPPPPAESGYVDLFSDVTGTSDPTAPPGEDPFFAAARASLPDGYGSVGGRTPDPFAPLREATPHETASPEPPRGPPPPPPMPKVPVISKPATQRSIVPIALMGAGVALLVGILAFVLLSSGKRAPAAGGPGEASAPVAAAPAPAPVAAEPPPPVAPEPELAQPVPETAPPPPARPARADGTAEARRAEERRAAEARKAEERRAAEERRRNDREQADARAAQAREKREAQAREKAERDRAAREARERDREEREQRAREEREARDRSAREAREARERAAREREQRVAATSEGSEPDSLTQGQIEGVLRASKPSFDSCMRAAQGSDVALDGRRVMLRLNIQPAGVVTYPTLDDVTLNGTELGSCLKSAARLMVFPKFKGDTLHVEVPLALAGR